METLPTYETLERDVEDYARVKRDVERLLELVLFERPARRRATSEAREASTSGRETREQKVNTPPMKSGPNRGGNRELKDLFKTYSTAASGTRDANGKANGKAIARAEVEWHVNSLHRRFNRALSALLDDLASHEDATPFLIAVDEKLVPDYYSVIERPMAVVTMREKLMRGEYLSKDMFLEDLRLIESNAVVYNGSDSVFAKMARAVVGRGEKLLSHMPRVDFVTCVRAAEYAEKLVNEPTLDTSNDIDMDDDDEDDDAETKAWRERTLAKRVRRVFRAKALAGLPIGQRRALPRRSAIGMDAFMRSSDDHSKCWPEADDANRARRPEDDDFVADAVPTVPRYAACASVAHIEDIRADLSVVALKIALDDRRPIPGVATRSITNVAARALEELAHECVSRVARAVAGRPHKRPRDDRDDRNLFLRCWVAVPDPMSTISPCEDVDDVVEDDFRCKVARALRASTAFAANAALGGARRKS